MDDTITSPIWPKPGTDNRRMLDMLIVRAPEPAWNLDKALNIKANSRASQLRKMGWSIEWVTRGRAGSRKRDNGYVLHNPPTAAEDAA